MRPSLEKVPGVVTISRRSAAGGCADAHACSREVGERFTYASACTAGRLEARRPCQQHGIEPTDTAGAAAAAAGAAGGLGGRAGSGCIFCDRPALSELARATDFVGFAYFEPFQSKIFACGAP